MHGAQLQLAVFLFFFLFVFFKYRAARGALEVALDMATLKVVSFLGRFLLSVDCALGSHPTKLTTAIQG